MAEPMREGMFAAVKDLFASGAYSDLTITCGDDTHKVHKAIVCPRSGFFAGAMRFVAGKEAECGTVDLSEDAPEALRLLLQFLYEAEYEPKLPFGAQGISTISTALRPLYKGPGTKNAYNYKFPHTCKPGCPRPQHRLCPHHSCGVNCQDNCVDFVCVVCEPPLGTPDGDASQLLIHTKVYQLADKYDIEGLKELAHNKFMRSCLEYWDTDEFVDAANHACATTLESDHGLRDVVAKTIAQHVILLNKESMKDLLRENGIISLGVLELKAEELNWPKAGTNSQTTI